MGRSRPDSRLVDVLSLLYQMDSTEINRLTDEVLDIAKAAYQDQIQKEGAKYGATRLSRPPSGAQLSELKRIANRDARGIANTYNTQVRNEIDRLYRSNPRGTRQYYYSNLEKWQTKRDAYKGRQIALNTEQVARQMATQDFRRINNIPKGRFIYSGPAPVSDECKARFRAGIVDENYVDSHPTPAHVNCPHTWEEINPQLPRGTRPGDLWMG